MNVRATVGILLYAQDALLSEFGGELQTFHDFPGFFPAGWGKVSGSDQTAAQRELEAIHGLGALLSEG